MEPRIIAVETAVPEYSLTQPQVWTLFHSHRHLSEKERVFYKRFLSDGSIECRYVACDQITDIFQKDPDHHHKRFEKYAAVLASRALRQACRKSGIRPEQLDGLIVTTCTGYLCPGLSSYLSGELGLKAGILAQDMVGHGCGAAVPALRSARQVLQDPGFKHVAVVSVEICTAAVYWGDDIDLILSNAIFADGAAAAIVTSRTDKDGLALQDFGSVLWPEYRDELRFTQRNSRLCNVISKNVPRIVGDAVEELHEGLPPMDRARTHYALHTGGRRILDEIARRLELSEDQMSHSRRILRNYGNMSSPSVLFVLKEMMDGRVFRTEDILVMLTFGAGFTAYAAACQWTKAVQTRGDQDAAFIQDRTESFSYP